MIRHFLAILLVGLSVGTATAASPHPLKGVALVIGETEYVRLPVLTNPDKDARDIDHMLDDLGFDVTRALDVRSADLRSKIDSFISDAKGADVALVYYAGHGIEAGGNDYIMGIDVDISSPQSADETLVSLNETLNRLKAAVPVTIMLLDACRTNPFTGQQTLDLTDDNIPVAIGQQGLEIIRGPTAVSAKSDGLGAVIGFSASPGQSALDGPAGENSPYASALLQHLSAGGFSFGDIMTLVTEEVYVDTGARQLPWTSSSLSKILYFGRDAGQPEGDDAAILNDRRKLLLDIASVPEESKAFVETVATQESLKLTDLYAMLDIINGNEGKPAGIDQQSLLNVAKRVREVLDDPILSSAPSDPELARLDGLANKAIAAGAFKRALDYRQLEAKRAGQIEKGLDAQQADIDARRKELAGVYARVAEAAMYALSPKAESEAYNRAAKQSDLFDKSISIKLRLRAANAFADQGRRKMDLRAALSAIGLYQDILKSVDPVANPAVWADTQLRMGETMWEAANRQGDRDLRTSALAAARAALTVFKQDGDFRRWSRSELLLAQSLRNVERPDEALSVLSDLLKATPKDSYAINWGQGQEDLGELFFGIGINLEADTSALGKAVDAYGAAAAAYARYDRNKTWSATLRRADTQVRIAVRTHDEKLARSAIATAIATLAQFTDHDPSWGNSLINLGGDQVRAGIAFGDAKLVRAGLATYAKAEKKVISEKTSRFDWGLAKIAEGDALRFLGMQGARDDKLLQSAITAYNAGGEALTGIDASPNNALFAHYKVVRLQAMLGKAVRPEDRALAKTPAPAALDVSNAVLSVKPAHVDKYREDYFASIAGATLDGQVVNLPPFYLATEYQDTSDPQRNVIVMRLSIDRTNFSDQASRTVDYEDACGDMAGQGGHIWLHYGVDSNFNPCVLSKMAPTDAATWQAVLADLPKLTHKSAVAGDVNAERIDPLFTMLPLRGYSDSVPIF